MPVPGAWLEFSEFQVRPWLFPVPQLATESCADNQTIQKSDWQLSLDFVRFWGFFLKRLAVFDYLRRIEHFENL